MRVADVASLIVLGGIIAQGVGLYAIMGGAGWPALVVGTEIALMGLIGVARA